MKPAPFNQKDHDKDEAKADCIKYGTPTPGVDHSNHYKPITGGSPMNEAELMQHMARGGYRVHQEWGLMVPPSPPVDEQPEPVDGCVPPLEPDGQAEGFDSLCDKDKTNPMPIKKESGK